MTGKSQRLLDYLIAYPDGITADDVCQTLEVTPSTFRGMIRDIGNAVALKREAVKRGGRRLVRHSLVRH